MINIDAHVTEIDGGEQIRPLTFRGVVRDVIARFFTFACLQYVRFNNPRSEVTIDPANDSSYGGAVCEDQLIRQFAAVSFENNIDGDAGFFRERIQDH